MQDNHADKHAMIKIKNPACDPINNETILKRFAENVLKKFFSNDNEEVKR